MKKLFTVFVFLFCVLNSISAAKKSTDVTLVSKAFQGDFITVPFYYKNQNFDGNVSLYNSNNKVVATAKAFSVSGRKEKKIAVLGVSTFCKPGTYEIKASINVGKRTVLEKASNVEISAVEYISEEIPLDDRNTAIKTDSSKTREQQIEKLNKILFSANDNAPRFLKKFSSPVASKRRTSFFGDRRVYKYTSGKSSTGAHYGEDFGVPTGTPIFSCGDGTVVMAESRISTGWTVVVEHFPGVYSLYYHMDSLGCSVGKKVKTGTQIGLSGATGLATGPHLHWEVRVNGEAVDPDFFLERGIGDIR
jgi:murein DD-endopeptidase MepM/ murein hydrolase activator NlpD